MRRLGARRAKLLPVQSTLWQLCCVSSLALAVQRTVTNVNLFNGQQQQQ